MKSFCRPAGKQKQAVDFPSLLKSAGLRTEVEKGWNGGLAGTRTLDQCLKRALLYQLSYQPAVFAKKTKQNSLAS